MFCVSQGNCVRNAKKLHSPEKLRNATFVRERKAWKNIFYPSHIFPHHHSVEKHLKSSAVAYNLFDRPGALWTALFKFSKDDMS